MRLNTDPAVIAAHVEQTARLLGLPIGPELLPSVAEHYSRLAEAANVVFEAPGEAEEPAPVFRP